MWSDVVVFVDEGGHRVGEADAVGDVLAVEALAFEGLEPALDDTVGARNRVAACQAACLYLLMRPLQRVVRMS